MGKSSLVHLIVKGSLIASPPQTVGCTVGVKVKLSKPFVSIRQFLKAMAVFLVLTESLLFSYSTLLMVTQVALLIASKVMPREISLLSSGMCLVMNDTKIVALCFIHKLMVSINILLIHNDDRFSEMLSKSNLCIPIKKVMINVSM